MNEYIRRGEKSKGQRGNRSYPFRTAAAWYRSIGWTGTIPVTRRGTKAPLAKGVTGHNGVDLDDEELLTLIDVFPHANIGLRLPWNIIGIDVDAYGDKDGRQTMILKARELMCPLPMTFRSTARAPEDGLSGIYLFRAPRTDSQVWQNILGPGVEIAQYHHRFATVAPSIHNSIGIPYKWWFGNECVNPPRPEDLTELPEEWNRHLLSPRAYVSVLNAASSKETLRWYAMVSDDMMCKFMREAATKEHWKIQEAMVRGGLHDALVTAVTYLCKNAADGHRGLDKALSMIERSFKSSGRSRNLLSEWESAIFSAMVKAAAMPQEGVDVCTLPKSVRRKSS